MASTCYTNHVKDLLDEKLLDEKQIDEAVYRILKLKEELGLFDDPFLGANPDREDQVILAHDHLQLAERFAEESMVLLKNDQETLPLSKKLNYVILGPYAETQRTNGSWAGHGNNQINNKLADQLKQRGIHISFVKATTAPDYSIDELKLIESADQIILTLGENEYESGEAHSKVNIHLPREQEKFVSFAKQKNKKTIVVLYHGRPFVLTNIMGADAILDAFYAGSKAHEAMAKILTGDVNPSGKLPVSYPRHSGQIPIYYNHLSTGRPHYKGVYSEYSSFYLDEENEALFPFGYGLSYAHFKYSNLRVSKKEMNADDVITLSVDVENDSNIAGFEIAQFYINDKISYYARPIKELKGYKKVWIEAHQKVTLEFRISKDDLSYFSPSGDKIIEPGDFEFMVGKHSEDVETITVKYLGGNRT
ncbi:MAG: hypothetical protein CVV58_06400 [Tenericutes bacterium HGW-Tenericutes-3]|nr:MAG: hypothetical protein CVV58_06400 [Tenericutes bacterium HGW-Tenericutes-3]